MRRLIALMVGSSLIFSQTAFALAPHSQQNLVKTEIGFELVWNDSLGTAGVYSSEFEEISQKKIQKLIKEKKFFEIKWDAKKKKWESLSQQEKINQKMAALNESFQTKLIPEEFQNQEIKIILLHTHKGYIVRKNHEVQLARAGSRNGKGVYIYVPVRQFLNVPMKMWVGEVLEEELSHALKKFEARQKGKETEKETFQQTHLKKLQKLAPYIKSSGLNRWLKDQEKVEKPETPSKSKPKIMKIAADSIKPLSRNEIYNYASGKLNELEPFETTIQFKNKTIHTILAAIEANFIGISNGIPSYVISLQALYPRYNVLEHPDKAKYEAGLKLVVVAETVDANNKIFKLYAPLAKEMYVEIGSYWLVQDGEKKTKYLPVRHLSEKLNLRLLTDLFSLPQEGVLKERSFAFGEAVLKLITQTVNRKEDKQALIEIKEDFEKAVRNIGGFHVAVSSIQGKKVLSFPSYVFNLTQRNTGFPINLGDVRAAAINDKKIKNETNEEQKETLIEAFFKQKGLRGRQYSGEVDLTPFMNQGGRVEPGQYIAVFGEDSTFQLYPFKEGKIGKPIAGLNIKITNDILTQFGDKQRGVPYVDLVVAEKQVVTEKQPEPVVSLDAKQEEPPAKPEPPVIAPKKEESLVTPIDFIRAQSDLNKKALLAWVMKILTENGWHWKETEMDELKKEYNDLFHMIGPILVSAKKDEKGHFISELETHREKGAIVSGKVRWTDLNKIYPGLIQSGTEVLLIPTADLSFKIAIQDKEGTWKYISGATLGLTNEFEKRFINGKGGPRPKYLDLEVTSSKGAKPFEEDAAVDFYSLFAGLKSDAKKALQINSSVSELIVNAEEKEQQLLGLVGKMIDWLKTNKKADFACLQAEFRKEFLSLGPIWIKAYKGKEKKDGLFLSYIPAGYSWKDYPGELGQKLRWTELFRQFPEMKELFQQGEDLLLVPNKDLSFSVVLFDAEKRWQKIEGAKVAITQELRERFLQKSKKRKFLDLVMDPAVSKPFSSHSSVNFQYLDAMALEKPKQQSQQQEEVQTVVFELPESVEAIQKAMPSRKAELLRLVEHLVLKIALGLAKDEKTIEALRSELQSRFESIGPILLEVKKDEARGESALISELLSAKENEEYPLKGKVRWSSLKGALNGELKEGSRLILVPAQGLSFDLLIFSDGEWRKVQGASVKVTTELKNRFVDRKAKNKKYMDVLSNEAFKHPFDPRHIYRFPAEYFETAI